MKKNFSNLLLLLEAEKAIMEEKQFSLEDVKNFIAMENVEAVMERFTEMQTEGWKTRAVDNVSVLQGTSEGKINPTSVNSYLWTELDHQRGSNEIASPLCHTLSTLKFSESTKVVRLFCDGWGGQNKNPLSLGCYPIGY
ncbi:unnamed protein product [Acanthoscelides obtectus]|uniref:Uncharacterized protein n=1 Tax=Acanthoscelides obtectus TaxID=200917 RepID=A0A9P0Q610_ACAOB|nr:unnamed protein product [Acanthoscelides obtectus]CAK1681770.1 hypothetical protein AOBTE_LOCUS33262 [Acanthoscelides obtectus]